MDELLQISRKLNQLEACGELRVVYINDIGAKAIVMSNTDKYVIALDPTLCCEQQRKALWHEAKHIYSHLNNDYSIALAETEAEEFSNIVIKNYHLIDDMKNT